MAAGAGRGCSVIGAYRWVDGCVQSTDLIVHQFRAMAQVPSYVVRNSELDQIRLCRCEPPARTWPVANLHKLAAPSQVVADVREPPDDIPDHHLVGIGHFLCRHRRSGDLARPDKLGVAEGFIDALRDLASGKPLGAPRIAPQRRNVVGIGRRVEQPLASICTSSARSRSISRECISISPAIPRAHVAQRIDRDRLFLG